VVETMTRDYVESALTLITVLFMLFAIFLVAWKVFGSSPTMEQLSSGIVTTIGAWLVILTYRMGRMEGKTDQMEKSMKESFERVREDLQEIKQKLR
jgi:ABC-type nickel/cobalt efflux system permease component RcnA